MDKYQMDYKTNFNQREIIIIKVTVMIMFNYNTRVFRLEYYKVDYRISDSNEIITFHGNRESYILYNFSR